MAIRTAATKSKPIHPMTDFYGRPFTYPVACEPSPNNQLRVLLNNPVCRGECHQPLLTTEFWCVEIEERLHSCNMETMLNSKVLLIFGGITDL